MAFPLINPSHQFFDTSGAPLVSGTIEFQNPTTAAKINTYPTADDADAQTNANSNPLTLDSRGGYTGIYLEDGVPYKVIIKDADGATVDTQDDVRCPILPYDGVTTATETAASVTPVDFTYPEGHVNRYGTNTTPGTTDMATAFNNASSVVEIDGGTITIPPGTYLLGAQWALSAPGTGGAVRVDGYGAELTTSGAISGLEVNTSSGDPNGSVSVYGVKINHRGNSTATYGFNCDETWKTRFYDCSVEAHGVSATYAGIRVGNSDATDGNTGSFWTAIENFWIRKRSGSDSGDIPVGILLEGNANATNIIGGAINNCDDGILLSNQSTEDPIPNGVTIFGVDFEGCQNDIRFTGKAGVAIVGPRIISCRAEDSRPNEAITAVTKANPGVVTAAAHGLADSDIVYIDGVVGMTELNGNRYTVANKTTDTFELSGTDTSAFTTYTSGGTARGGTFFKIDTVNATTFAPYLCANWISSNIADYIRNDNSIPITSLDHTITPDISGEGMTWTANTKITSEDGSSWALTLQSIGGARGLLLNNSSGSQVASLQWTGSGTGAKLTGVSGGLDIEQLGTMFFGSSAAASFSSGSGTPESAVTAPVGSLFVRTDGGASTTLYVKESGTGNTGWIAK